MPKKVANGSASSSVTVETVDVSKPQYKALDQRTHVLHRPDMYIGGIKNVKMEFFGATMKNGVISIKKQEDIINPGLLRCIIEVLSNIIDNVWRSSTSETPTTKIKIDYDTENHSLCFWNDGLTIPIEINKENGVYNPQLIFGQLLTSSNYNDDEERMTSGRNGLGAKATNIFSKEFRIKTFDIHTGKQYVQTWKNNMSVRSEPIITSPKQKNGYTEITFTPDYALFEVDKLSDEMVSLVVKHVIDTAMITNVPVYFNGEKIPVKSLKEYALCYEPIIEKSLSHEVEEKKEESDVDKSLVNETESTTSEDPLKKKKVDKLEQILFQTADSECVLQPNSSGSFQAISFVNGIYTEQGGVHVEEWKEAIFRPLLEKINSGIKKGGTPLTIKEVNSFFRLVLKCTLPNPAFTSQEKTKLVSPKVTTNVEQKQITSIMKWSVMEKIKEIVKGKEIEVLKKQEKKRGYTRIENLDSANLAGTKHAKDCTLVLCEGLSARSFVIKGLSDGTIGGKKGRDYIGCFSLRGKPLNTLNANVSQISGNKEISGIIQSLRLRYDVDYTDDENFKTLSYGRVCLLSDADDDGAHITGLVLAFFERLFPSLLQRPDPFVISMRTPVVRLYTKGKETGCFYSVDEFKTYTKTHKLPTNTDVKYYKGLGTSSDYEIKQSFGKKMVHYLKDEHTHEMMEKVFLSKYSDKRKEWLRHYEPSAQQLLMGKEPVQQLPISQFLDKELILFSISDCKRSLPSLMDGLKPSQRKLLYTAFEKNLTYGSKEMKVAQFGAATAQLTDYHHGEMNLSDAAIKMAQRYIGSNNISLFFPGGQFGTRISNGDDAASSRYIFTKQDRLTRLLFRKEDDVLLEAQYEDKEKIEPVVFVPILPMILINGGLGIGTAFSCSIPMYNPLDIIQCVQLWLTAEQYKTEESFVFPELTPWYNGFKGTIEKMGDHKFLTKGIIIRKNDIVTVREIPIGMSIDGCKEVIEELLEHKKIKSYQNYSNDVTIQFDIKENKDEEKELTLESLKLTSTLSTNNMVLFDEHGKIKKYNAIGDILESFCRIRYSFYMKRKAYMIGELTQTIRVLQSKLRFLTEVMNGSLVIQNVPEETIFATLQSTKYPMIDEDTSYSYLLGMHIRSFSKQKVDEIQHSINRYEQELRFIQQTSESQLWMNDIMEFKKEYEKV